MLKPIKKLGFALLVGLSSATIAQAEIAYTSPDYVNINNSPTGSPWCTTCPGGSWEVSDVFTLSSTSKLTGVDFGIWDSFGSNHNIQVSVLNTDLTSVFYNQTFLFGSYSSTNTGSGVDIISLLLSGPTLDAGTYRMAWYDPVYMVVASYKGLSTTLVQSAPRALGGSQNSQVFNEGAAFQIYADNIANPVPEPEIYAMLATGLGMLGFVARRRKLKIAAA